MKDKKFYTKIMSTNFKKQEDEVRKVLWINGLKVIKRAKTKRLTSQIRIPTDLYRKITENSKEEGKTRSKIIELICRWYYSTTILK